MNVILDEDAEMTQMWLIPAESEEVEKIYSAMVQCQILNPDPNDSLSEDGEFLICVRVVSLLCLFIRYYII